jgi:hypothetical protein
VSYSRSLKEALAWFIFWIVLSAISTLFPYHLGALVPVFGILAGLGDLDSATTGPAIAGAVFTAFLSLATSDQIGALLYFLAAFLGVLTVVGRAVRSR